jgi:hypothetical protein
MEKQEEAKNKIDALRFQIKYILLTGGCFNGLGAAEIKSGSKLYREDDQQL